MVPLECSACGADVQAGSRFCPGCGVKFSAPPRPAETTDQDVAVVQDSPKAFNPYSQTPAIKGLLLVVVAAVGMAVFSIVSSGALAGGGSESPPPAEQSQDAHTNPMQVGSDGVLGIGSGLVVVARTEQDEHDLTDASAATDKVGYDKVVLDGRAFLLASGTHAKLIGYGGGLLGAATYHVRVTDGPYASEDGWVPMEFMKPE